MDCWIVFAVSAGQGCQKVIRVPFKSAGFRPKAEVGRGVIVGVGGILVAVLVELGVDSGVSISGAWVGIGSALQAASRIMESPITSKQVGYCGDARLNEVT